MTKNIIQPKKVFVPFKAKAKPEWQRWRDAKRAGWNKIYSRARHGELAPSNQKCWAGKCGKFDQAALITQLLKSFDIQQ